MKKIISISIFIYISLLICSGCDRKLVQFPEKIAYNSVLYDSAGEWIKDGFSEDELWKSYIVDSKEKYNEIFKKDYELLNINYDKQMIIVYVNMSITMEREFLYSVEVVDDVLTITYSIRYDSEKVRNPYTRYFVVVMDKIDVTHVNFVERR